MPTKVGSNPNIGFVTDTHVYFLDGMFSQWKPAVIKDLESGNTFANAEQYMMYYKALTMKDGISAKLILAETHPARVKKLGRGIIGFDEDKWDEVKENIVYKGNYLKFTQNPDYLLTIKKLVGRTFVECSYYDRIWGIGLDISNLDILDESKWLGLNLLGKAISKVAVDIDV